MKVHPRGQHAAGKAAASGALGLLAGGALGLLLGGLFGLPVVGLAARAAAAIHRARRTDDGIDDAFVAAIGEQIAAGGSAIFVLVGEGAGTARAAREVAKFGGTVHGSDLPPDRLTSFQAMLDQAGPNAQSSGTGDSPG